MLPVAASLAWMRPVLVAGLIAACGGPGFPTPDPQATPSPWGPLAVYVSRDRLQALWHGTLRVDERCSFLELADGERLMLAWPYPETVWDASSRRAGTTLDGRAAWASDGERVSLGGGTKPLNRHGWRPEEYTRWIWPPALECITNDIFFVSGIERP